MATGPSPRGRVRRPLALAGGVAGVLAVAAAGGLVLAPSGADGHGAQLRAWSISARAPVLPVPVDDLPAAPAARPADEATPTETRAAAPEAAAPAGTTTQAAATPDDTLPSGAPSDAQVEAELRRSLGATGERSGGDTRSLVSAATLTPDGLATIPPDAPAKVAEIIRAGNQVARKPYVYGGGHGRLAGEVWNDSAYDCSGSISFALAAAGLIDAPMTSGALAAWGARGAGRWVTIFANDGHTFMYVAGLRFDTSGRAETGSRWQVASRSTAGFTVVHPRGL
jgi:cell wall-associated NlpC family hydrolase